MYSFDYKSSALPTELNWLSSKGEKKVMFFLTMIKCFIILTIQNLMQRYAEVCRDMSRKWPLKWPPKK